MTTDSSHPLFIIEKMIQFVEKHSGGDFGGVRPPVDQTQYKKPGKAIKRKGGKPPVDYYYVEEFVDLQLMLERGEWEEAIPLYYKLKRLV